jgi:hypothetical protein
MRRPNSNIVARETQTPAEIVARLLAVLTEIDRQPLPVGKNGAALLDLLELIDQIREKVRAKIKQILLEDPAAVPVWTARVIRGPRGLVQDLKAIHESVREVFPGLSFNEFLGACKTSFAQLQGVISARSPGLDPKLFARELDRALSDQIRIGEPVIRLVRSKPLRIPPPPQDWTPPEETRNEQR